MPSKKIIVYEPEPVTTRILEPCDSIICFFFWHKWVYYAFKDNQVIKECSRKGCYMKYKAKNIATPKGNKQIWEKYLYSK